MIEMDGTSKETLAAAIHDASWEDRFMSTKGEIIEYYRDTFGRDWRKQFTADWMKMFNLEDSKRTRNTVSRQVQGERANKDPRRGDVKDKYRTLGRHLPPYQVPKNLRGKRAVVTVTVYLTFSDGKPMPKGFTRTLSIKQTQSLLETGGIDAIIEAYGINVDDVEYADGLTVDVTFI